jgi:hypothetical protein
MSERRTPVIERILHRIEEHVEDWRRRDAARNTEAASHREELWAEATERQKLLAEAVADGETPPASLEEVTRQHRIVFVLHREDLTGTLEAFAGEKDRLVHVVPGKGDYGSGKGIEGIRARGWCSRRRSRRNSLTRDRTLGGRCLPALLPPRVMWWAKNRRTEIRTYEACRGTQGTVG